MLGAAGRTNAALEGENMLLLLLSATGLELGSSGVGGSGLMKLALSDNPPVDGLCPKSIGDEFGPALCGEKRSDCTDMVDVPDWSI